MLKLKSILALLFFTFLLLNCEDTVTDTGDVSSKIEYTTDLDLSDWSETTHGKGADPDYDIVFPQDKVNRIDIVITENNWDVMLEDMTSKYGSFGGSSGRPAMPSDSDENPIYVPCSFYFNNVQWYQVGIRFKGNSSLTTAWQQGIWKLPFRLHFDKFEDDYPEINNQRFYGFKELALSSNYDDNSLLREKVAPEIFRDFGVAAPQTAFYRVYIDNGDGPIYFGLYTMVEKVEDTMLDDQFSDNDGNLYKPEGTGASFAVNSFNTADFEKKTNEETDWSDIENLFDVLHSSTRTSDASVWRNNLEATFNVDVFLKWLAVNNTIQNWDTYGRMTHNYYLYNNPKDNRLTWIPWDNNEAFQTGKQSGAISITCNDVSNSWPLIRYLIDDEVYLAKYKANLKQVIEMAFEPSNMISKYQDYSNLIREHVVGENGEKNNYSFLNSDSEFDSAVNYLISHVNSRNSVVKNYVD
ncbi:MAG: CotH kinase family protein [Melioribacteraceae bacterium]|nr:CotH kinase family protein [Melioribacteraceae bacterium]